MIKRNFVRGIAALTLGATVFVSACREDALVVGNPNQPDVALAFRDALNVEVVISKIFQQMFNGQYGVGGDNIWTQALVMAFESSSSLGNFGMGTRSIIPRPLIDNSIGNNVAPGNYRDFDHLTRNARQAADAINALNAFIAANAGTGSQARDARAKSFAFFELGYALGHLSLIYDSAAAIVPGTIDTSFKHYTVVNAKAIEMLDSAIAITNTTAATTGSGGWPIPLSWWLSSGTASSGPNLVTWRRILRSYRAKFRANVARTPAEGNAVNWTAVRDDAINGIIEDVTIQSDPVAGWFMTTLQQLAVSTSWSQMTPMILGMADTGGVYEAYLAQPIATRSWGTTPLRTPDQRWPVGNTRAEQQTFSGTSTTGTPSGTLQYMRNRPSGDAGSHVWGVWQYDMHRFWLIRATGGTGTWVLMARAESDLLAAEAYIRLGDVASAVPLINRYRTPAGLPAIPTTNDVNTQVPGGNACVPQVPLASLPTGTTVCGDVYEAMKYEKRMETIFTGHSQWFMDARRWGDLYPGTPLHWPVPYQELFAREKPTYTTTAVAGASTYGF